MANIKAIELKQIGESLTSLNELNELISVWANKRNWYIFINRVNKKGWLVYGLSNEGKQTMLYCGLGVIEQFFDSPITSLNDFINR